MNLIDAHTHLPGRSFGGKPRPIADLRREFANAGLCGAWIFTTDGLVMEAEKNNNILAEAVRGDRDFFEPFGTVNPHAGEDAAIRELERMRFELGMRGLKLHPWLQGFSLTHPSVKPILQRAGEMGLPVLFHDGTPPYSHPLQIAAVAEQVPSTMVILGHAGLDEAYEDAILACRRHPNLFLCLCGPSCGPLAEIVRRCPVDRLLFGSDGGFGSRVIETAIAKFHAAGLSQKTLQTIGCENPRRLVPKQPRRTDPPAQTHQHET
ncbi:MAG: amidohydrolase [Verrucomicrobia bacterium]|nr:amidohydrolase [Verrucomicrobiota bacterium]